ncbi:hypothetical protein PMAYCL1PPCAC_33198, partial [Pristionchus mayeri]
LVLEDFSEKAVSSEYIPGFTLAQVECLMDALASWHAYMFEHPEKIKCMRPAWCLEDEMQTFLFNESLKLEAIRPDWFKDRIIRLEKYFTYEYSNSSMQSYMELGIPPVIVHMDLNTTNVLWKKETIGSSKPEIMSIIDFQQVH